MKRFSYAFGLVVLLGIGSGSPAAADTWSGQVGLQCKADVVAVRTGGQWDAEQIYWHALPERYRSAWNDVAFATDNRCTLANGDEVVLRAGSGRSLPKGEGALNPPVFVSLWINGKKVLSRVVTKHGYSQQTRGPFLNSIFVSRKIIERCAYPDGTQVPGGEEKAPVTCQTSVLDLDALPIDPLEAPYPPARSYTFASAYNPDFCASFVRKRGDLFPQTPEPYRDMDVIAPPSEASFPFPGDAGNRDGLTVETATFDFWNNGMPVFAVRYWYEDGWNNSQDYVLLNDRPDADARAGSFIEALKDPKLRETPSEVGSRVQKDVESDQ